MEFLEGLLGNIGNTDDIPAIIDEFARILMELLRIITSLLKGDFSAIMGTEPSSQA